jgi:hypothetical protein
MTKIRTPAIPPFLLGFSYFVFLYKVYRMGILLISVKIKMQIKVTSKEELAV